MRNTSEVTVAMGNKSPITIEVDQFHGDSRTIGCTLLISSSEEVSIDLSQVGFSNSDAFEFQQGNTLYKLCPNRRLMRDPAALDLVPVGPGSGEVSTVLVCPLGEEAQEYWFCVRERGKWKKIKMLPEGEYQIGGQLIIGYWKDVSSAGQSGPLYSDAIGTMKGTVCVERSKPTPERVSEN